MQEGFERSFARMDRMMRLMFLLVSVPCLLAAAYMSWRSISYVLSAERTVGQVVAVEGEVPQLVVEFRAATGQTRTLRSTGSDLYANFMVGDEVDVLYRPRRPQDARLDLFVEQWLLPTIIGAFGLFFFLPVLLLGGGRWARGGGWRLPRLRRPDLDREGRSVQAEYQGFVLGLDRHAPFGRKGRVELGTLDGQHTLVHDGRERNPLDPLVQRELGIHYRVLARWRDPQTGTEYHFESEPLREHPERLQRGLYVSVRIHPQDPTHYRFEPPFGPPMAAFARTSAIGR